MSHEMRTSLNAILGFSQLMEYDKQAPLAPNSQRLKAPGWGAITKKRVELMGGEIGVDSASGNGSTFWFKLAQRT